MSVLRYYCFRWLLCIRVYVFEPSRPLACNIKLVLFQFVSRVVLWYLPMSPRSWSYTFACMISVRSNRGHHTPAAANSMMMPVDIAPALRRKTPILAKSTPNPVAKSLFEPERAPIVANRNPIPFLASLEDKAYIVVRNFVRIFPSWKDYTADTEQFPVFLCNLCISNVLMLFMVITAYVSAGRRHKISFF